MCFADVRMVGRITIKKNRVDCLECSGKNQMKRMQCLEWLGWKIRFTSCAWIQIGCTSFLTRNHSDRIDIKEMKDPYDMVASGVSRAIFICDYDNRCIWRIQMPSKEISRWEIDGRPWELSINSSDELIVVVLRYVRSYIDVYRCEDGERIKEIFVDGDVAPYVVQSSNGNFIIAHESRYDSRVRLISEVSIDGTKIIRSFDPRSIEANDLEDWWPRHLSIDEDDNIFVADHDNHKVDLLNPRLDEHQILVNGDQHQIDEPRRLCYVREKQMLIVGHGRGSSTTVSLFSLSEHRP